MNYQYRVMVMPGLYYDCIGAENLKIRKHDLVIIRYGRYLDCGLVADLNENPVNEKKLNNQLLNSKNRKMNDQSIPQILRVANSSDADQIEKNEDQVEGIHEIAVEKIANHKLKMKLINTHLSFDQKLAVFQFSASGRVDFRSLLRDLSQELDTRVELRQIGVRDEASVLGGLGPCGRKFCCSSFLHKFVSINVRMAKIQGLSLNPNNISGNCGRLKCCLHYEYECYNSGEMGSLHSSHNEQSPENCCNSCKRIAPKEIKKRPRKQLANNKKNITHPRNRTRHNSPRPKSS